MRYVSWIFIIFGSALAFGTDARPSRCCSELLYYARSPIPQQFRRLQPSDIPQLRHYFTEVVTRAAEHVVMAFEAYGIVFQETLYYHPPVIGSEQLAVEARASTFPLALRLGVAPLSSEGSLETIPTLLPISLVTPLGEIRIAGRVRLFPYQASENDPFQDAYHLVLYQLGVRRAPCFMDHPPRPSEYIGLEAFYPLLTHGWRDIVARYYTRSEPFPFEGETVRHVPLAEGQYVTPDGPAVFAPDWLRLSTEEVKYFWKEVRNEVQKDFQD